jgi:nucleoside-diphosphate-sugar epimerase
MQKEKLLLLGFGDIAKRLAHRLSHHYAITGVRRRAEKFAGVKVVSMDCTDKIAMQALLAEGFDLIVITMTPSDMSDTGYEHAYVNTLKTLLAGVEKQTQKPRLIVFVSSTSVYGQQDGEWVNESSPTEPTTFSGKRLLEAETLLNESPYTTCLVRFSGIYGPGRRRLIEQVMAGHGAAPSPVVYSNRIHADDCAGVLAHIINKQKVGTIESLYLASDCAPVPLCEVKQWLAEQLQLPATHLQPMPINRMLRSSKRVSNQRLVDSGYLFHYPSFREGYSAVLNE